jgi:hypothetical protein
MDINNQNKTFVIPTDLFTCIEDYAIASIIAIYKNFVPSFKKIDIIESKKLIFYPSESRSFRCYCTFYDKTSTISVNKSRDSLKCFIYPNIEIEKLVHLNDFFPKYFSKIYDSKMITYKISYTIPNTYSHKEDKTIIEHVTDPIAIYKENKQLFHELMLLSLLYNHQPTLSGFYDCSNYFHLFPIEKADYSIKKSFVKDLVQIIDSIPTSFIEKDYRRRSQKNKDAIIIRLKPIEFEIYEGVASFYFMKFLVFRQDIQKLRVFSYLDHEGLDLVISVLNKLNRIEKFHSLLEKIAFKLIL